MTKDEWYRQLFERLGNSSFRSSFHLKQKDIDYINEKGLDTIRQHAKDFIAKREAPAYIANDGKQTPMKGLTAYNLAVGSSITFVDFIWSTYENQNLDKLEG